MHQSRLVIHTLLDAATVMSAIAALSFSATQIASLDQELKLDITVQPSSLRVQIAIGGDRKELACKTVF